MRAAESAVSPSEGVPLDLEPLLSIYGRNRRLSLRVERLPDRARLSRGRNNGDRSWSLMREDLHDLRYLPPEGVRSGHTLAVRVINLDTDDGATLAVFDFPVSHPSVRTGITPEQEAELLRQREELTRLRALLDVGSRQLAEAQAALEQARAQGANEKAEHAAAKALWEAELDSRLATVRAESAANLEISKTEWLTGQSARIQEARARWQAEAETALTRAKEAWRAEEAARVAQAEALWREQSAQTLAEVTARAKHAEASLARAEADAARMSGDGVELRRLRGELAEASATLNARARELAETRHALELARAEAFKGKEDLAAAHAAWQIELENRITAEKTEAAARLASLQAGDQAAASEQIIQGRIAEARAHWRQELETATAKAREIWKAEETARLARTEEQWREKLAVALSESAARLERAEAALARAQAAALHESADGVELRRMRDELAAAKTSLSDRESRLSQAKLEMQRARERWKAESEIALKKAQEAWKAEEAYRISVLRGDWQKDMRVRRLEMEEEKEEVRAPASNHLLRDGLFAAALAVVVVFFYPSIMPMLAQWLPSEFIPGSVGAGPPARSATAPKVKPVAVVPNPHMIVSVRAANVRSEPSNTADIVVTLAHGAEVTPLERRGSWEHVRVGEGSQAQDGWIFGAFVASAPQAQTH